MAETAAAAITEAMRGYRERDPDRVLAQFHDEALIIGTREEERWNSKEEVRDALTYELGRVHVEGPLTDTGAEESFTRAIAHDMAMYFRDGYMVFNGKRVRGRWSAIVRNEAADPEEKDDWKIVHSHFSLAEGHTTPDGSETLA